jgi:hypothetical protein
MVWQVFTIIKINENKMRNKKTAAHDAAVCIHLTAAVIFHL